MASPLTVAAPAGNAAVSPMDLLAQQALAKQRFTTDAGVAQTRLNQQFAIQAPALKSAIGSAGQFYSSARQDAEANAGQDFSNASYDVTSALQRNIQDQDQARMYAATGLII